MDRTEIDEFLAERRNAILGTINARNEPIQVPVYFNWQNDKVYISVTSERGFFPNLRRNPRVSVCVDDDGPPPRTVLVRGEVEVIEGDAIWPPTEGILDKYMPADRKDAFLERMRKEPRVILAITPTMITSWMGDTSKREIWRAG